MENNTNFQQAEFVRYVIDGNAARAERYCKRMFIIIVVLLVGYVVNNCAWLHYISQYDFESYELSTDGGGDANYIGNDGVI